MTWNASSDPSGIDRYDVFRDDAFIGSTAATELIDTGLEPDTLYEYRISAVDTFGNASALSDPASAATLGGSSALTITLWYGDELRIGTHGIATPFANILGNVQPSPGTSITRLDYSIGGGPRTTLSIGPNSRRLADPGDFNADIPITSLSQGDNVVDIVAADSGGNMTVARVTVRYTPANVWPLPFVADWSTANAIQDLADVLDGNWAIQGDMLRPLQLDYDRLVAIGDRTWSDYEITTPVTIHSIDPSGFDPPSNDPAIGYILRWPGHSKQGNQQPNSGFLPLGAVGWYRYKLNGNNTIQILGNNLG
ncbi:MAG TPA: fibronectin type III domain-containing protein, partial [Planctomycetota bacterium]|nr:fibronectin type III domain-containing protein [Planctomycetota bacterium]